MERKHRYIKMNYDDYSNYWKTHRHNRLDRWNRIWAPEKTKLVERIFNIEINEEVFDGLLTNYSIDKTDNDYLIGFKTNSNTEYRFDLTNEPNTDKNIYHLSFSLYDMSKEDEKNYEDLTNKNEALEVLNRLLWILKDVSKTLPFDSEYCIGFTDNEKKNRIYAFMMRGIEGWERRETPYYSKGWGLYFKLN